MKRLAERRKNAYQIANRNVYSFHESVSFGLAAGAATSEISKRRGWQLSTRLECSVFNYSIWRGVLIPKLNQEQLHFKSEILLPLE